MAYTALRKMQQDNKEKYGIDIGPIQPSLYQSGMGQLDLKSAALEFIHHRCEGLRFDSMIEQSEANGSLKGTSTSANQIPYNMEKDIDRLCLERAIERFLDSGTAHDAFDVYFCYLEMFIGAYGKSRKIIELLSEFELNGSSLLMKHRDHYSHSVYVFALGLAIYHTNELYRNEYKKKYGFERDGEEEDHKAAHHYLQYWGLTSLFHDIGYPFELPFEQVESYFEKDGEQRKNNPYISYNGLECYTGLTDEVKAALKAIYGKNFEDMTDVFAYDIAEKLGVEYHFTRESMKMILDTKPTSPNRFGYFMDHAYFSSIILFKELLEENGANAISKNNIDALTAIILHNSLYKFSVTFLKNEKLNKPFKVALHPLAYMLMLCDELQCWDRTAYGRNSRTELHPFGCEFTFIDNGIQATYIYDENENEKITEYEQQYDAWIKKDRHNAPKLKAYASMVHENEFKKEIEKIVDLSQISLTVETKVQVPNIISKNTYLSDSNFISLYNFAVALNARYNHQGEEKLLVTEQLEEEFSTLSLEYKLSNICQAKAFAGHLHAIGCFYTDRPVPFQMITKFTEEDMVTIGPLEHERWLTEHSSMAWSYGTAHMTVSLEEEDKTKEKKIRKALREQFRCHQLMLDGELTKESVILHYNSLPVEEQNKDLEPMNSMLELVKKYDGLRIYKL